MKPDKPRTWLNPQSSSFDQDIQALGGTIIHLQKQGLATLLELIGHTCRKHGIALRQVSRWYPSSQLCHDCGYRNTHLTLRMRAWNCPECGARHDRDVNAALNLRDATEYHTIE